MGVFTSVFEAFSSATPNWIIAQCFGVVGLVVMVLSFQFKSNRSLFIMQSSAAFCYVLHFLLLGAWAGTFFNLCTLIRGVLFMKNSQKLWKLILVETACVGCYVFSLVLDHSLIQIILVSLVLIGLLSSTYFMWRGETKKIRYCQIACTSPFWIAYNVVCQAYPGVICECFNMVSSAIFLIRSRKQTEK